MLKFPIGELQADFSWITESTVSPEKEIGELGTISFKYNTAEIRIAQTFLSSILTMEAFESKITEVIALAYRKAMDTGIMKARALGQMLGILNDPRVTSLAGTHNRPDCRQRLTTGRHGERILCKAPSRLS